MTARIPHDEAVGATPRPQRRRLRNRQNPPITTVEEPRQRNRITAWDSAAAHDGTVRLLPLPAGSIHSSSDASSASFTVPTLPLLGTSAAATTAATTTAGYYSDPTTGGPAILYKYSAGLSFGLVAWLVYLVLPKGIRKAYCRAGRRRYAVGAAAATSTTLQQNNPSTPYKDRLRHDSRNYDKDDRSRYANSPHADESKTGTSGYFMSPDRAPDTHRNSTGTGSSTVTGTTSTNAPPWELHHHSWLSNTGASTTSIHEHDNNAAAAAADWQPSPEHPALARSPDVTVLQETMHRLLHRGIRLTAHGVQCEPKRVWIRLHMPTDNDNQDQQECKLSWQTEFPRQITDAAGGVSIVLFRGAMHPVDLKTVLYVDVGKKTSALLKDANGTVPAQSCFSLLTASGSLDLQTNSRLERDALVACLSVVLDFVHQTSAWRRLYEESTIVGGGTGSVAGGTASGAPSTVSLSVIGTDLFGPTATGRRSTPTATYAYF